MGPYYEEKQRFLKSFFEALTEKSELHEEKNIMLHEYLIKTSTMIIEGTESKCLLGLRKHDSAVVLFDRLMTGSDESNSFNVFDDHPYFEIVAEYEAKGFYYKSNNKRYCGFTKGIVLHRQISLLMEKFVEIYKRENMQEKEKETQD